MNTRNLSICSLLSYSIDAAAFMVHRALPKVIPKSVDMYSPVAFDTSVILGSLVLKANFDWRFCDPSEAYIPAVFEAITNNLIWRHTSGALCSSCEVDPIIETDLTVV